MKKRSFFHQMIAYLTVGLITCHSPLQMAATQPSLTDTIFPSASTKQLANGFTYILLANPEIGDRVFIKLALTTPLDPDTQVLALLTQQALFYGTKQLNRQNIQEQLHQLGLDIHATGCLQVNEQGHALGFSLPSLEHAKEMLTLLPQLLFEPLLDRESIELARQHLLQTLDDKEDIRHTLAALTQAEVQAFHAKWYRPSVMHLSFMSATILPSSETLINQLFNPYQDFSAAEDPLVRTAQLINQHMTCVKIPTPDLTWTKSLALSPQPGDIVIDGKIWMKEPNWINKSSNGKWLGIFLIVVGVGGLALTPLMIFTTPIMIALTATGVYFIGSDYFKDPSFVQQKRQEDLENGFEYAYRHQRAGITLTPYERRAYFLQEMAYYPPSLSKAPILLLADLYDLSKPVLFELFLIEEMNFLAQSKQHFIHYRNQYKILMEQIEQELLTLTLPYAHIRDLNLARAQEIYHQNPYIIHKRNLKRQLDENIVQIEQAYHTQQMTLEARNEYIDLQKKIYQEALNSPDMAASLAEAEAIHIQMEGEALAAYNLQVAQCKIAMQYDQRMVIFKNGEQSLVYECDTSLRTGLSKFPLQLSSLPDFIDLR